LLQVSAKDDVNISGIFRELLAQARLQLDAAAGGGGGGGDQADDDDDDAGAPPASPRGPPASPGLSPIPWQ